jgi:hypothetical protein
MKGLIQDEPGISQLPSAQLDALRESINECFRQSVSGMTSDLLRCGAWDIELELIECPVDVWVRTEDVFTPVGMARASVPTQRWGTARLEEVQGEGHFTLFCGRFLGTVVV